MSSAIKANFGLPVELHLPDEFKRDDPDYSCTIHYGEGNESRDLPRTRNVLVSLDTTSTFFCTLSHNGQSEKFTVPATDLMTQLYNLERKHRNYTQNPSIQVSVYKLPSGGYGFTADAEVQIMTCEERTRRVFAGVRWNDQVIPDTYKQ